jgi:hypothetical protein
MALEDTFMRRPRFGARRWHHQSLEQKKAEHLGTLSCHPPFLLASLAGIALPVLATSLSAPALEANFTYATCHPANSYLFVNHGEFGSAHDQSMAW